MNVHSPFFIDHLESTTATCHFKSLGLLLCIQKPPCPNISSEIVYSEVFRGFNQSLR
jgi:hypothetical protein